MAELKPQTASIYWRIYPGQSREFEKLAVIVDRNAERNILSTLSPETGRDRKYSTAETPHSFPSHAHVCQHVELNYANLRFASCSYPVSQLALIRAVVKEFDRKFPTCCSLAE